MLSIPIIVALTAFRVPRTHWGWFLTPILIAYTCAAGPSTRLRAGANSSAVRACIMAVICFSAPTLARKADISTALALSAILILAARPK